MSVRHYALIVVVTLALLYPTIETLVALVAVSLALAFAQRSRARFEPLVAPLFDDATMRLVFADPRLLTEAAVCASHLDDHLVVECDAEAGVTFSQVGTGVSTFVRVRFERDAFVLYEMRGGRRSFVLDADNVRQLASHAVGAASIELIERPIAEPTRLVVRLRSQQNDAFTLLSTVDSVEPETFELPAAGFPHAFRVTLKAEALERLIGAAEHAEATFVSMSLSGQRLLWHAGTTVVSANADAVSKLSDDAPSDAVSDCYFLPFIRNVCGFTALASTATLSFGRAAKVSPPLHIHFAFADARIGVDVLVAARQDD